MIRKVLIYGLVAVFLVSSAFGVFGLKVNASTYGSSYGNSMSYGSPSSYPYGSSYGSNMGIGSRGQEVVNLQMFLVSRGFLIMPYGTPYGYFGPLTQNAWYRYQSGNGSYGGVNPYPTYPSSGATCPAGFTLTTYNGVFGCFKFPNGNNNYPTYPNYNYDYNNNYNNGNLQGDDGTVRNFDAMDGDDTDLEENDNDQEVMEMEFDVEDGDVRLDRVEVDFEFTGNSNGEDQPWDVFENARLELDGDEIANVDAEDEDEWNDENDDTFSITFTGINEIIRENDTARLTLVVDTANNIDGVNDGDVSWDLFVPDNGIRVRNGSGDTDEIGDDSDTVSVDFNDNGGNSDRESAQNAIDDAQDAIDNARDEIDNADDDGEDVDEARDLLNDAENKLDDANEAFDDQDYNEAEDLANDAENLANDAVDAIGN